VSAVPDLNKNQLEAQICEFEGATGSSTCEALFLQFHRAACINTCSRAMQFVHRHFNSGRVAEVALAVIGWHLHPLQRCFYIEATFIK
jgi:hypothetical protein